MSALKTAGTASETPTAADQVAALHGGVLFGEDEPPARCLFAVQHWLAALALLKQAESQFRLAELFQARELAGNF